MARPREFDEDAVLDAALRVFWTKGYDGASIDDLVAATGIARASLYGAFGDKERLFARVLDRYASIATALDVVDEDASPRDALVELTSRWVRGSCETVGPGGCFLQQAGFAESSAAFASDAASRAMAARSALLERLIARGQKSGGFPKRDSPLRLARFLLTVQQGIAASARAGVSKRELATTMRIALGSIIGER